MKIFTFFRAHLCLNANRHDKITGPQDTAGFCYMSLLRIVETENYPKLYPEPLSPFKAINSPETNVRHQQLQRNHLCT